jgi:hypothetical protein
MSRVPSTWRERIALIFVRLLEAIMAVDIGAVLLDAFMVLVIAVGLVLLAAMLREQLPHRRSASAANGSRFTRSGPRSRVQGRTINRRAA